MGVFYALLVFEPGKPPKYARVQKCWPLASPPRSLCAAVVLAFSLNRLCDCVIIIEIDLVRNVVQKKEVDETKWRENIRRRKKRKID